MLLVSQLRLRFYSDRGVKGRRRVSPALSYVPTTWGLLSAHGKLPREWPLRDLQALPVGTTWLVLGFR